ncbi:hypothetical protein [Glutamicibacter arilaitensis]|uniref:hypothetical protein n=1 Tax=Glutamicibacter arilaitensis TaxID=256701 RepID=UPI003FCF059F
MTPTETMPLQPTPPAPPANGKSLNIILAVLGGLVILTLLVGTARGAVASLSRDNSTQGINAKGVTSLDISANSGRFQLLFADTEEAILDVNGTNSRNWEMRREGNRIVVDSPDSWGNWCFFGCGFDENDATLVLPESLNNGSLDADFELAAGSFNAVGNYKNLVVEVGAGKLELSAGADTADISLGAGRAEVSLADVKNAKFDISAGHLQGTVSGEAPKSITAEISAGSLALELPDAAYDVRESVAAGDLKNLLVNDPSSPNKISMGLSAGSATLYSPDSGPGPWEN